MTSRTSRRAFCAGAGAAVAVVGLWPGVPGSLRTLPAAAAAALRRLGAWLPSFLVVEAVAPGSGRPADPVMVRCRRDPAVPPERLGSALSDQAGAPFDVLRAEGRRLRCEIDGVSIVLELVS